jgi:hypothetical protein
VRKKTDRGVKPCVIRSKSTGPKTAHGKNRSKYNATKHGVLSKVCLLEGEPRLEFEALLHGLIDDFQPQGTFETGLVGALASTWWRQRRLLIAEGAEIESGRDFLDWDEKENQRIEAPTNADGFSCGGLMRQVANPEVLERCLQLLDEVRGRVEQYGFRLDINKDILLVLYGNHEERDSERTPFDSYDVFADLEIIRRDPPEGVEITPSESLKEIFLEAIDNEKKRLQLYKSERDLIEARRQELEYRRRSVPLSPRLEQLLRYSVTLERTFDRILCRLERAQRMRLGQNVSAPIELNLSS